MSFILPGSSGATTTPGGADTNVQFNDAGAFGGQQDFYFNKALSLLGVGSIIGSLQSAMTLTPAERTTVGAGYALTLTGGTPQAGSNGGAASLFGGASTTGSGGSVTVRSGASTSGSGGNLTLAAGDGTSLVGGSAELRAGSGSIFAGEVLIRAGNSTNAAAAGGIVNIRAGFNESSGIGGSVNIQNGLSQTVISVGSSSSSRTLAFFNATRVVQQTVTGSWGGNAAGANLAAALATYGLIINSTTA
jgi:hypothetical protein